MPNTKKHALLTVYLWLVSLISFIGLAIAIIVFAYQIISLNLISTEEYIAQNHWEIDRCEEPMYLWNDKNEIRTPQEQQECITKATTTLELQRNINAKETLLLSGLRGVISLIIFPLHFLYFRRNNKQD